MRIGFFDDYKLGAVKGDQIVDFLPVLGGVHVHHPQELMVVLIENWPDLHAEIAKYVKREQGIPLSGVSLLPPLPRPDKIVCMAVNYFEGGTTEVMPEIDAFLKDSDCVIGDGGTVFLDPASSASVFHHEAELAVVIGNDTSQVAEEDAMNHVFGYTGFLDVSGRTRVRGAQSYFQSKSWATFGPMGPFIVTKDEVPNPHNLKVSLSNNGFAFPGYSTSDMAHKIPECVAFASRILPLTAGSIISTGTNHQNLGPMQTGDSFVMDIENIGSLHINVQDPLGREWPKGIDEEYAAGFRGSTGRP